MILNEANGPAGVYVAPGVSGDVVNAGTVKAAVAALTSAGGNVYALAGNRGGLVQATGTETVDGQVWLTAPGGEVGVSGTVSAANADGTGGAIVAKGQALTLADGAVLDATGKSGHGRIETSGDKVSIGKAKVTAGKGGNWLVDLISLFIDITAAGTIDTALGAGTNVTEQTTATGTSGSGNQASGVGDIVVDSPLSWSTSATLTLSAFNGITVNAPITVTGDGTLVLTYNNNVGGINAAGTLAFLSGQGSAQFTTQAANPSLFINNGTPLIGNGTQYTLIYAIGTTPTTGIQSLNGSSGNFALAAPLDATSLGAIATSLVPSFSGSFNGLGNTISNLTVSASTSSVGLFGTIGVGGSIANFGSIGGSVTTSSSTARRVGWD